jgi:hypothetical protein
MNSSIFTHWYFDQNIIWTLVVCLSLFMFSLKVIQIVEYEHQVGDLACINKQTETPSEDISQIKQQYLMFQVFAYFVRSSLYLPFLD